MLHRLMGYVMVVQASLVLQNNQIIEVTLNMYLGLG
jgi:hypothetical protein